MRLPDVALLFLPPIVPATQPPDQQGHKKKTKQNRFKNLKFMIFTYRQKNLLRPEVPREAKRTKRDRRTQKTTRNPEERKEPKDQTEQREPKNRKEPTRTKKNQSTKRKGQPQKNKEAKKPKETKRRCK